MVGEFAQAIVAREVEQNQFAIATDKSRITVSWQVTGTRRDPWAIANRIEVETDKTADERGQYLHPEVRNKPQTMRLCQPATQGDSRGHVEGGELSRISALLSPEQNERLDRTLQAAASDGGAIDQDALRNLIAEGPQNMEVVQPDRRNTRADLERSWRDVEDTIAEISRKRPWLPSGDF